MDGERMNRATNASRAVSYYANLVGNNNETVRTSVVDLLADLMHLSYIASFDFEDVLDLATMHYEDELAAASADPAWLDADAPLPSEVWE
jgi:hypothetical protein